MPSRMKDEALLSLSVFGSLAARHCKSLRSVFITTLVVYLIEPDRSLPHPFRYTLVHPVIVKCNRIHSLFVACRK